MKKIIIILVFFFFSIAQQSAKSEELFILKNKILLDESEIQLGKIVSSITFTFNDHILVSETMPPYIHLFNNKGRYIKTIAKPGEGPSELPPSAFSHVNIFTNGDIYISSSNNTLRTYDLNGNFKNSILLEGGLKKLYINKNDKMYSSRISGVKKDECVLKEIKIQDKKVVDIKCLLKSTGKGFFNGFSISFFSLDFDADSNIYAIEGMDYTVYKYDFNGNLIKKFAHPGKAYLALTKQPPYPIGGTKFVDWENSFSKILLIRIINNKYVAVFYIRKQIDDMNCDIYSIDGKYLASAKTPASGYPVGKDKQGNLCTIAREVSDDGKDIKTWIKIYSLNEKILRIRG